MQQLVTQLVPDQTVVAMGIGGLGITELCIVLLIALIIFGPSRIPKVARSLGDSVREFRNIKRELNGTGKEVRETVEGVTEEVTGVGRTVQREVRDAVSSART